MHCSDDRGSSTITVDDTVDDESIAAESGHDDTGSFDDINDRSPTIEDSAVTNDFSEEKFVIIDEDSLGILAIDIFHSCILSSFGIVVKERIFFEDLYERLDNFPNFLIWG